MYRKSSIMPPPPPPPREEGSGLFISSALMELDWRGSCYNLAKRYGNS